MIKVCLVDDHTIVREGLKQVLNSTDEIRVVDEAANAKEFFKKRLKGAKWDLVILDLSLPDLPGLDVLADIKSKDPFLPVLILTMHNQENYALKAFELGASGYVTKESAATDLAEAVIAISKGEKDFNDLRKLLQDLKVNESRRQNILGLPYTS